MTKQGEESAKEEVELARVGGSAAVESARGNDSMEGDEGEWAEYVDSLGRSRRCLKEDLPEMMRRDRDMITTTRRPER